MPVVIAGYMFMDDNKIKRTRSLLPAFRTYCLLACALNYSCFAGVADIRSSRKKLQMDPECTVFCGSVS